MCYLFKFAQLHNMLSIYEMMKGLKFFILLFNLLVRNLRHFFNLTFLLCSILEFL
jgi:hypothetical protein